jgi:hypothetical protein
MAVASQISVQAQNFTPIPLTANSFTYEIVVPSNCPAKPNAQMVTVTLDNGPTLTTNTQAGNASYVTLSGNTMFEVGLYRTSAATSNLLTGEGVPPGGTLLTNITKTDHIYRLPYWTNSASNCCFFGNYANPAAYTGGVNPFTGSNFYIGQNYTTANLAVNTGGTNYTALSLLDSSGNGAVGAVLIFSFADGSTQTNYNVAFPDWFNTFSTSGIHSAAYNPSARLSVAPGNGFGSTATTSGSRLYGTDIGLANTNSAVTNINFTWVSNGRTAIFAVSGTTNPASAGVSNTAPLTGPFVPIPVSGFNAGCVVPNIFTNGSHLPYNATMDNGTNYLAGGFGANTWGEVGWDSVSTNGFPIHGTSFTSFANPNRTYQMAPTYTVNMSTLIDINHKSNNITPITPLAFTAISFLTAGANNGTYPMSNYCILQHADGVNESNIFLGYDWFNNTVPYAWIANSRPDFNNGYEVDNNQTGDPRLFESTFQTTDGTPVTNIAVGFFMEQGTGSTTFILGISGTTNFVLPQIGTNTAAQNVYAGQTAVFSINLVVGTHPTPNYQWQLTDGATFTNNIGNGMTTGGSTISGATTPTLTIANVSSFDTGNNTYNYQCLVSNPAGSAASPAAPLTLRVSTATNVVQVGDPISDFYGGSFSGNLYAGGGTAGEAYPSPAGLTVNYVIDGTDEQYLNYGASGSDTVFTGPVGVILQPSAGSSIVTAARFIAPVNAPICDPADFELDGSPDGINWKPILPDTALAIPNARNILQTAPVNITNQVLQEIDFPNTTNYSYYRVVVQNVKNNLPGTTPNSMQIGELQLLGSLAPIPPGIFLQPSPPVQKLQVGGKVTWTVAANGPQPITYQWYQVTTNGVTNLLMGATAPSFTLASVTLGSSGSYYCSVSNMYGSTNSILVSISVLSPTSGYVTTIVDDGPIAFLRLDEGPDNEPNDGVIAYDTFGGHNGYYSNTVLQFSPGYSPNDPTELAAEFGQIGDPAVNYLLQDNLVAGINGINFYTPTNTDTSFSVEAWVYLNSAAQIGGAGIVSKGYGGGGEEFALDTGGTDNCFRFYYRNSGGLANGNVSPNAPLVAGVWYHVVGILSQSNNVTYEYIYTNGILGASSEVTYTAAPGVFSNDIAPVVIGSRSSAETTNYNDQLEGAVADVAIYPYALTSNQVLNHYLASGIGPIFSMVPTNLTVEDGQTAPGVFYSSAYGSPTVSYQWQLNGVNLANGPSPSGTGAVISGATSSNLSITGATPSDSGETFTVVASNAFGINTASATLTVAVGPPVVVLDVPPTSEVFAGSPFILTTAWNGTAPFTYQWTYNGSPLNNGPRISGATNSVLTINPTELSDAGTYQLVVINPSGFATSSEDVLTVLPILTFNGQGSDWSVNGSTGGGFISPGDLELTIDDGSEARSFFYESPLYVGAFEASYIYTDTNGGGADGVCFVLQDDPRGAAALGAGGGSLGYAGITPSVSLQFNIYSGNAFGGQGVAFGTDGLVADVYYYPDIASGDPLSVSINYNGYVANILIVDTLDTNEFLQLSTNINIPAILGSNLAYVGFTGADGGVASIQTITDFQYIPLPSLTASISGGDIVLSWPEGTGAYILQSNNRLTPCEDCWIDVTNSPMVLNNQNVVTLPLNHAAESTFFRLMLQPFAVPETLSSLTFTILFGDGPFAPNGSYLVTASGANGYTLTPISGPVAPSAGTYTYSVSGVTGTASLLDENYGPGTIVLTFTSPTTGTFETTFEAAPGAMETGTFVIP